ncbi:MAG: TetM/TetW/TetO/TetS family tetracycline resistance ribosomal protection protein, partial [Clostridia bacterium]
MERKDEKVLTLGIFAHANAGKTTITEHLLYHTNVISNIGRVDSGNTVTDNMKIEQERGITVRDTLVSFKLGDKTIQLIDTPGHVDFSAEVERAINVLDGAVLVISGVEGLEAQTYIIWRALKEKNIPVIIFINKMDRLGADYDRVLSELQNNLEIPTINFKHIVQPNIGSLEIVDVTKEELIEELSLIDDETMENYVEGREMDLEKLFTKIITFSHQAKMFPVVGGSALIDVGIEDLINCIKYYIPSSKKKLEEDFAGYVYTVRVDDNGKNAYIKVLNGEINLRDNIKLGDETSGKVKKLFISDGSKLIPVDKAFSGDLVVANGLDVKSGQVIGNSDGMGKYISFVKPLLTMEINSLDKNHNIELMNALKILDAEDPYLNVRYNKSTNSIYCSLMGDVQAQIIKTLLKERFGLEVNMENPTVIHKEVPTQIAQAKATYTTVSGIGLEVTPLERGSGFKYVSKVSTDYLHLKYQRQVERLINYYAQQGLHGWELT